MSLRAALTADLPLKLTSLALSLFLWLLAAGEEPVSALMKVDLTVQAPPGRTLLRPPGPVRALVVGPRRELLKLSASPIRITRVLPDSVEGDDIPVELSPGEIELPRGVTARVQDVQPHTEALTGHNFKGCTLAFLNVQQRAGRAAVMPEHELFHARA